MIAIRASGNEVDVSGTVEELLEVALTIRALVASVDRSIILPATTVDPAPYDGSLGRFVLNRTTGKTVVSIGQNSLVASGSDASLVLFSSWFEFPSGVGPGYHNHFEPLDDDQDHSSSSVSLVVSVCNAGA